MVCDFNKTLATVRKTITKESGLIGSAAADRYLESLKKRYLVCEEAATLIPDIGFEDYEDPYLQLCAELDRLKDVPIPENNGNRVAVNLPSFNLPTFDGNLLNWSSFHAQFKSLVHDNASLSPTLKLAHLLSVLKGKARDALDGLEVTDKNYPVAITILKQRFSNVRIVCQEHIRHIYAVQPMKTNSTDELLRLMDCVTSHLRALTTLGRQTMHWDDLIVHLMMTKLHPQPLSKWEDSFTDTKMPTLDELMAFLRSQCYKISSSNESASAVKNYTLPPKKVLAASSNLNSTSCLFCKKDNHSISRCFQFMGITVEQRMTFIVTANACRNCLGVTCQPDNCISSMRCKSCNGSHHSLLHNAPPNTDLISSDSSNFCVDNTANYLNNGISSSVASNSASVCLPTAVVNIVGHRGQIVTARALLDSGSQINLVTDKLVSRLGLNTYKSHTQICGVGETYNRATETVNIKFRSHCSMANYTMNAAVMGVITSPIAAIGRPLVPAGLDLADPEFDATRTIDLLIGAELFFDIMGHHRVQSDQPHLSFRQTTLGYIVTGSAPKPPSAVNCAISLSALSDCSELRLHLERQWLEDTRISVDCVTDDAEGHFMATPSRDDRERFVVHQPPLGSLSPFLGSDGPIRVGRRLKKATGSYHLKHPYILPANHHSSRSVVLSYHCRYLHAGSNATIAAVREKFWPLNGRRLANSTYRTCIRCCKDRPRMTRPPMEELPSSRISAPALSTKSVWQPLMPIPDRCSHPATPSISNQWNYVQELAHGFWTRWSSEYIRGMLQRTRWQCSAPSRATGDLVLIADSLQPPMKWTLGRIDEVHPGKDGIVRVATVRTVNGSYMRPINKLCRLPLD